MAASLSAGAGDGVRAALAGSLAFAAVEVVTTLASASGVGLGTALSCILKGEPYAREQ
jgi:hypothetical protein